MVKVKEGKPVDFLFSVNMYAILGMFTFFL